MFKDLRIDKETILVSMSIMGTGYIIEIDRTIDPLMAYVFKNLEIEPLLFEHSEGKSALDLVWKCFKVIEDDINSTSSKK